MNRLIFLLLALLSSIAAWSADNAGDDPRPFTLGPAIKHSGCCDASAGVAVSSNLFLVANDEDNLLRVYRRDQPGPPVQAFESGRFLHVDPKKPETDIEGAARVGDRIYWITSHGRNRSGETRESRHRFFATEFSINTKGTVELKAVGTPYVRLLSDFGKDSRLARFNLVQASLRAPKEPGGLNIEGMCSTAQGEMFIGFRNPIPNNLALVLVLKNPGEVVEGKPVKLGEPFLLDLNGRGIRDMSRVGSLYFIVAGPSDGKGRFDLYTWDGHSKKPGKIPATRLKGLNPEALVVYPEFPQNEFQILSDDGTRQVQGMDCKRLPDPTTRSFRSFWARWE